MPQRDLITTQEAAEISGYHPVHLRRLLRQGKIKAELKGMMYWISKSSLVSFLRETKKTNKQDKRYGPKGK